MGPVEKLDKDTILSEKVFNEIFDEQDEIKRTGLINKLSNRAKELKVKTEFNNTVKIYQKVVKQMLKKAEKSQSLVDQWTNFTGPYSRMKCGAWIAADNGVYSLKESEINATACYHPILPIERLKNLETGDEQLKIAYKRNDVWKEIIVPKDLVATANKITALSKQGIAVTSENARLLVRYLSDVENLNDNEIKVQYSSSKLGWIGNGFIPYDADIVFDGDNRFKQVFNSIGQYGSKEAWYKHTLELRATGRIEIKFMLAASLASVLVDGLGALPFIVDLWGETEGGKSVTLMLACSVWANPGESKYIGDFKTTEVALETRANLLNHLPIMLDDTSKTSARIREDYEGIIYDLCSGKGKSRSNKELGMNYESNWRNTILTNGEQPLSSYVSQGGAINRILELECGEKVYDDPHYTAEVVKKNYGFAGKDFVELLKKIDKAEVEQIQKDFLHQLSSDEKMQKQSISLSVVLTADKLATEQLFKDGQYITIEEAKTVLIDRNEVSDNERGYQYILDKISMNSQRFDTTTACEKWGIIEDGYALFYNQAFAQLCKDGGFSKKGLLSWAAKKSLLQMSNGQVTKVKKIDGRAQRCVWLKIDAEYDEDGFKSIDNLEEELPFK